MASVVIARRPSTSLGSSATAPQRRWGAWLLAREGGRSGAVLAGALTAVAGAIEVVRALIGKLPGDFTAALIARPHRTSTDRLARAGVLAHGAVLLTVGLSILRAGVDANARELVGTGGARGPSLRPARG